MISEIMTMNKLQHDLLYIKTLTNKQKILNIYFLFMGFTTRKQDITTLTKKSAAKGQKAFLTFNGGFYCGALKHHSLIATVDLLRW